jgi:hypothetical protein
MPNSIDFNGLTSRFHELRNSFGELHAVLLHPENDLDISLRIPRQADLSFDVHFYLSGDELHITAGSFWLEWFPADNLDVVNRYFEAAEGLLSGEYRIVEHYRRGRPAKAQLQRPTPRGWETIGTWSNFGLVIPGRGSKRILQKGSSDGAV